MTEYTLEVLRLEACPLCNAELKERRLTILAHFYWGQNFSFCSWKHFNEFNETHQPEQI